MINIRDIINGQAKAKSNNYNTDLFQSESENITQQFNKRDYEVLELITTDIDTKTGLLKETIIGYNDSGAYLINTVPSSYNGEVTVSIFEKWLTLQGFNFFIKEMLAHSDNAFVDHEGKLTEIVIDFYNWELKENGYNISYQDVRDLGEFNSQYNCITLSFESEDNKKHFITINDKQQLSKITVKNPMITAIKKQQPTPKSILD